MLPKATQAIQRTMPLVPIQTQILSWRAAAQGLGRPLRECQTRSLKRSKHPTHRLLHFKPPHPSDIRLFRGQIRLPQHLLKEALTFATDPLPQDSPVRLSISTRALRFYQKVSRCARPKPMNVHTYLRFQTPIAKKSMR